MTITDGYCTLADLKAYLGIGDTADDGLLEESIEAASRAIDAYSGRPFYSRSSATARTFVAWDAYTLRVDEFHTTTDLVISTDDNDDGAFETTWSASDYELDPPPGAILDGIAGWPYQDVRAIGTKVFPVPSTTNARRYRVQVTAKWGWAATPTQVERACKQVAAELFRRKDAPFGIAQTVDFGPIRLSADAVGAVSSLLTPFRGGSDIVIGSD